MSPVSISPTGAPAADPRELLTIEQAASLLHLSVRALRARCRRALRPGGRQPIARLGGGVTAYKIGTSWRVRIDTTP
jgi:hypothetical protein